MAAPNRCLVSLIIFTIAVVGIIATVSLILGFLIALYTPEEDTNGVNAGQGGNGGGGVQTTGPPYGSNGHDGEFSLLCVSLLYLLAYFLLLNYRFVCMII